MHFRSCWRSPSGVRSPQSHKLRQLMRLTLPDPPCLPGMFFIPLGSQHQALMRSSYVSRTRAASSSLLLAPYKCSYNSMDFLSAKKLRSLHGLWPCPDDLLVSSIGNGDSSIDSFSAGFSTMIITTIIIFGGGLLIMQLGAPAIVLARGSSPFSHS